MALPDTAGYVLAGGRSTRMGRDKALLPWHGRTLLEHVSEVVLTSLGNVTVIGAPERYGHLNLRIIPDLIEDRGPLGGLYTALSETTRDWNLLLACDMPEIQAETLRAMLDTVSTEDAVVAQTERGLHPLCAVYHRRLLPAVAAAVRRSSLKMHDFLASIDARPWPVPDPSQLANVNTPQQLESLETR